MIPSRQAKEPLAHRLPKPRGKLLYDTSLADLTWFRVGGKADVVFLPADEKDLSEFLSQTPRDIPITVLGVGSNILVRDGGVRGVVVRLGRTFAKIETDISGRVRAGAAALDVTVARAAADASIAGLEFLCGIPGSVGGGLRMNAGAYGTEFKNVLRSARGLDRSGGRISFEAVEMGFTYRNSTAPEDIIFVEAVFQGRPGKRADIDARMKDVTTTRESTQPIRARTGGSTFKNPVPELKRAWELIESAGCRGLSAGDAQVSEQHCNFLINRGKAKAADLEALGEEVRRRVREKTGIALEWEIKRIGEEA